MAAKALKPCPFCGGDAKFVEMYVHKDEVRGFVKCAKTKSCCEQSVITLKDDAFRKWNTRVNR